MLQRLSTSLAVAALCAAWPATGQDLGPYIILKQNGKIPYVGMNWVDQIGAQNVHQLLEENFVVFDGLPDTLPEGPPYPVVPIDQPKDFPHLPICQCPEDYRALLYARIQTPEFRALMADRWTIPAQETVQVLKDAQIGTWTDGPIHASPTFQWGQ